MGKVVKFDRRKRRFGDRSKTAPIIVVAAIITGFGGSFLYASDTTGPVLKAAFAKVANIGSCNIKGNISYNNGQKIYHVPGQLNYEETVISKRRGERWFCSENEARVGGWRKARR